METTNYTSIGPVLQLNKAGELTQKRMKAVKVCDGLYITEPDKSNFVRFIIECNGVMWVESSQSKSYVNRYTAMMPEAIKKVKAGFYGGENCNNFCREIDRRINHPEAPAIMELKKPERKKPEPLPEGAKKVSVYMCKGCTAETTDKKVVITELAPHIYTYTYKLKKYGERVKVVFEIDGVYFEAVDKGACYMERKDFAEVCTKAYASARKNVDGGAAQGMPYFVEVQKRIDAATPTETPQISTEAAETKNVSEEGDNAENEPQKHISEVLKEAERNYQCVKSETLRTVREADGKWHTYFMDDEIGTDLDYDQINHIPASRTAQAAEEVAEIRRYLNRLNGNHIADADYYLAEMREGIRQAEASRHKKNAEAEGEKEAERAENAPKRKIQYFHYTPEQLKRYIIDVYEKRANGEWVLLPYAQIDTDAGLWDVVDGKIGWWTNWRREKFSEMNMDFNSPTCGRCCKINRTYQTDNYVISNEKLLEFTLNGDYYYIQRQIYSKGGIKECYTIMDALGDFSVNDYSDTLEGIMRRFDKCYKGTATIIWQASETPTEPPQSPETGDLVLSSREDVLAHLDKLHGMEYDAGEVVYFKDGCTAEEHEDGAVWRVYPDTESDEVIGTYRIAPQSPETPQTLECTADAPKPRETTRKRLNRGIGRASATRRDTLRDTLRRVTYVPRECSTADAAYW